MRSVLRYLRQAIESLDPARRIEVARGRLFRLSDLRKYPRMRNQALIRSRARAIPLGSGDALCWVLGRFKMIVDTRDTGLSGHLMMDGYWEMFLTEAIAKAVKPGMIVADIGANVGYYTMLMGDLVGPTGWVHAFEPNPPIADRLRRSVSMGRADRRTTIHEIALSDHEGEASLFVPDREPKNATVTETPHTADSPRIALRRFDGLAGIERVDVVKIDVEGAEEAVWRGMTGLLDQRRPLTVFLEFCAYRYADPARFADALFAHGFDISLLHIDGRRVPMTREALLALPADRDQTLVLTR